MRAVPVTAEVGEVPQVLDGAVLSGAVLVLARMLDRAFLDEAGWDPAGRVLSLPSGHPLLGRTVCRARGCASSVHAGLPGVCLRCFTRLTRMGLSNAEITAGPEIPPPPAPAGRCAVPGCRCRPARRSHRTDL